MVNACNAPVSVDLNQGDCSIPHTSCFRRFGRVLTWGVAAHLIFGAFLIMSEPAVAQTQADLDKAKLAADIAEQQKKAAEAKKAVAAAEAEAAAVATKAANDIIKNQAETDKAKADAEKAKTEADKAKVEAGKAKFEVEKAEIDAFKAGLPTVPDTSKYKVDKPSAPTLNATVGRLTFEEAKDLAASMGPAILSKAGGRVLVGDDGKVRALMAVADATNESLILVETDVKDRLDRLDKRLKEAPTIASPTAALAIGSLLENILAYATILRTQYGFGTASTKSNAEEALTALIVEMVVGQAGTSYVDPDGAFPMTGSVLMQRLNKLKATLASARTQLANAPQDSRKLRETTPPAAATEAEKAAFKASKAKAADLADLDAEALAKSIEDAQKFLVGLFVVDAQGTSPFDAAQRGETLKAALGTGTVALLSVKVIPSDADTVATDRLFSGFKAYVGTSTIARWKLVGGDGKVIAAGADVKSHAPQRVQLTDNPKDK